jgi:heme exporter protein A
MSAPVTITLTDLTKAFSRRVVFRKLSTEFAPARAHAVTGRNGSGKTTLLKVIAGVLSPTSGAVAMVAGGAAVPRAQWHTRLGYVGPYLQMYDEFTALENLEFIRRIRGVDAAAADARGLLERVGLHGRGHDLVRTYSSGMKQRVKYAAALIHDPPVLILDEPTSNLDAEGTRMVYDLIAERKRTGMVIIGTNDREDLELCESRIDLQPLE